MHYTSTTRNIEVVVTPKYVESQINKNGNFYIWSYHIHIFNKSGETLQLVNRYWKIIDETGGTQEVSGAGVIGEQPILTPNSEFKYSSGVNLRHPSGIMSGHYEMQDENNQIINVKVPAFSLDIPNNKSVIN
ncbi:MAG: ApaG protein [Lentimonas sp.]|jgi:ApaG protein